MILLSDLHLGDGSPADDFCPPGGQAEHDLRQALCAWRDAGLCIVLVGDVLDLWQASFGDVMRAHGEIIEELFSCASAYVVGNHDADMRTRPLCGLRGEPHLALSGVWIEHGHSHDPVVRRWPLVCKAVCGVVGWLERRLQGDVDLWAEQLGGWLGRTGRHGANDRYIRQVARCAAEHGCAQAVFGHTHAWLSGTVDAGTGVTIHNCGTWTNGHRDVVSLKP